MYDPRNKGISVSILLQQLLFTYRTAKHCTTKETPAQLMFNRDLRNHFSLLRESKKPRGEEKGRKQGTEERQSNINRKEAETKIGQSQKKEQFKQHGKNCRRFKVMDKVMVRDYRNLNKSSWTKAIIQKVIGKSVYLCRVKEGNIWKRHVNQIIPRSERKSEIREPDLAGVKSNKYEYLSKIKYLPMKSPDKSSDQGAVAENKVNIQTDNCAVIPFDLEQPSSSFFDQSNRRENEGDVIKIPDNDFIVVHYDKPDRAKYSKCKKGKQIVTNKESDVLLKVVYDKSENSDKVETKLRSRKGKKKKA